MAVHFDRELFAFLADLRANNRRDWFDAHRDRYVAHVEAPMLAFIRDLAPHLRAISSAVTVNARRTGGSMYRIHRDTRFSADKSPYKTHVAAIFSHEQKKEAPSAPGFYLHLSPGECLGGGGIYHPDMAALTRIRLRMVDRPQEWRAIRRAGLEVQGERLKRAPAGFDAAHPLIEDLRLKDAYALVAFTEDDVCRDGFLERYVAVCHDVAPLVAFLTRALGWRW